MLYTRKANLDDLDFCLRVKEDAFRNYREVTQSWDPELERDRIHRFLVADQITILSLDGLECSFYCVEARGDALVLHNLFVLNACQSKGLGAAAIRHIKAISNELKLPIRLQVLNHNSRALAFYLREGFHQYSVTETHIRLMFPASRS